MSDSTNPLIRRPSMAAASIAAAVAGCALLVFTLATTGIGDIVSLVGGVGWGGAAAIVVVSGLRFLVRALAWRRCVEGTTRLGLGDAVSAVLMAEALGNLTPLTKLVSEPAKAVFVRHRVPFRVSFPALVVENIFYSASVAAVIAGGAVSFLMVYQVPVSLRAASALALAAMAVVLAGAWIALRRAPGALSGGIGWARERGWHLAAIDRRLDAVRAFEVQIGGFWDRNRAAVAPVAALEAGFHLLGLFEVFLALWLMGGAPPPVLAAFVLESTGRVINVAFSAVPMRVGVDEWGNEVFGRALGLGAATGTSLALVRKGRVLFWTAVGGILLVARGLTIRQVLADADRVRIEGA